MWGGGRVGVGRNHGRQFGVSVGAQFLQCLCEWRVFVDGFFHERKQFLHRHFDGNDAELRRGIGGYGVRRRERGGGSGDNGPFLGGGIITEFSDVPGIGEIDVNEPMARFGMDVNFGDGLAARRFEVDANDEVAVARVGVVTALLIGGQIPMRVKPMRVARCEQKGFGTVGFGQLTFGREFFNRRCGAERVTLAGTADGCRSGPVTFEQNRGNARGVLRAGRMARMTGAGAGGTGFSIFGFDSTAGGAEMGGVGLTRGGGACGRRGCDWRFSFGFGFRLRLGFGFRRGRGRRGFSERLGFNNLRGRRDFGDRLDFRRGRGDRSGFDFRAEIGLWRWPWFWRCVWVLRAPWLRRAGFVSAAGFDFDGRRRLRRFCGGFARAFYWRLFGRFNGLARCGGSGGLGSWRDFTGCFGGC